MRLFQLIFRLVCGFAIGALIGIIFTPRKGSKIRMQIFKEGRNYAEEMKGKIGCTMECSTEEI